MTFIVSKTSAGHSIVARDQEIAKNPKPNQNTNMGFYYLIFEVSLLVKAINYIWDVIINSCALQRKTG